MSIKTDDHPYEFHRTYGAWLLTSMHYSEIMYKNVHCNCKIARVILKPKRNVNRNTAKGWKANTLF